MGAPRDVSLPVCSTENPVFELEDPVCSADSVLDPDSEEIPPDVDPTLDEEGQKCLDPSQPLPFAPLHDSYEDYISQNSSVLYDFDYRTPACRGEFSNPDDYLKVYHRAEREAKFGAALAALPINPEEEIPTDTKVKINPNEAKKLSEVWAGLPEQVRVYFSTVKDTEDLGIAYETVDEKGNPKPHRWHVFPWSEAVPAPAAEEKKGSGKEKAQLGAAMVGVAMIGTNALRVGETGNSAPAAKLPTGGSGKMLPPTGRPTANLSIGSALAGTGIMIGISLAINKFFPDLPGEPRAALGIGSMYTMNYLMFKAGLYPNYNWKTFTGQLPTMVSYGMALSLIVDGVARLAGNKNFQAGTLGHDLATTGLSLGAYYTIASSETLAPLLTGGTRSVPFISRTATGALSFAPAGGGGVLGAIGQGARIAGIPMLINLGLGVGKWANYHISGDADTPEGRLDYYAEGLRRLENSSDVFGKYGGAVVDATLGHLADGIVWTVGQAQEGYHAVKALPGLLGRAIFMTRYPQAAMGGMPPVEIDHSSVLQGMEMHKEEIKNKMIDGSVEFGKSVRFAIADSVARNIDMDTGQINWTQVEEEIRTLYAPTEENPDGVENVYKVLEYTGFKATKAQEVKDAIEIDGTVKSRSSLESIAIAELERLKKFKEADVTRLEQRQTALLISIGAIKQEGNETTLVPNEALTLEQQYRIHYEVFPLAEQVVYAKLYIRRLGAPSKGKDALILKKSNEF